MLTTSKYWELGRLVKYLAIFLLFACAPPIGKVKM